MLSSRIGFITQRAEHIAMSLAVFAHSGRINQRSLAIDERLGMNVLKAAVITTSSAHRKS